MCLSSIEDAHSIYEKSEVLLCFGMNTGNASGKLLLEAGSVEQPTLHQCVSVYMSENTSVFFINTCVSPLILWFAICSAILG